MRKPALLLLTLAAVVLGLLTAAPANAAAGSISGHTDGAAYEEVFLIPAGGGFPVNTYVDDDGDYVFESVQPGSYYVCWHDWYNLGVNTGVNGKTEPRDCYQGASYTGGATVVTVGSGQHRTGVDLTTSPWGMAVGQVTDAQGEMPEGNITVHALVWSERDQEWQDVSQSGVSQGRYNLVVVAGVPFRVCVDFIAAMGPPTCLGGLEVWDADDHTLTQATLDEPYDELPTLTLPDPADITGTVTDPSGNPIPDVTARAQRLDANGEWQTLPFIGGDPNRTDVHGVYHLPYTVAGTYRLCFTRFGAPEWTSRCWGGGTYPPGDEDPWDEADLIEVEEGEIVDGIDVTLTPFFYIWNDVAPTISGKLRIGSTVSATDGTWSPSGVAVAHEWRIGGQVVGTGTSFEPTLSQLGDLVTLRVTGTKEGGAPKKVDLQVGYVDRGRFTMAAEPKVTGKARVGSTVKVTSGSWSPTPSSLDVSWCVSAICYGTSSLTIKKSWRGKKLYAKVVVQAKGYKSVAWTSEKRVVR